MKLGFLDRTEETRRLRRAFTSSDGSFCCLYGRRRCGKSRLLQEVLPARRSAYYVGDHREERLQRQELASSLSTVIPGFDRVVYPDWVSLLERWWGEAPPGAVLALDEFPFIVQTSRELPSVLQKFVDRTGDRARHVVICGSSRRMMQGLVLDASAPLYGRAREIIEVKPLAAPWICEAFETTSPADALRAYAVWGGVPRYWELARDHPSLWEAVSDLVLDPMGVLHEEPERLLADDIREPAQAASLLALVGRGCHRLSEIAARLGKPATSLARPMSRLQELGLVRRETPFGTAVRAGGRSIYRIDDPFLAFWFRFVEPHRSLLGAGRLEQVTRTVAASFDPHVAEIWESLVRLAVPRLQLGGRSWGTASRWWGPGLDHRPLELDAVATSSDGTALLVGEAKLSGSTRSFGEARARLRSAIERLPIASAFSEVIPVLFVASAARCRTEDVVTAEDIMSRPK